jgi:hypothetical protein
MIVMDRGRISFMPLRGVHFGEDEIDFIVSSCTLIRVACYATTNATGILKLTNRA